VRLKRLGLAVAAIGTVAMSRRTATDPIPESATIAGYAPISSAFGYDPQFASELYEHPLTFYNFEPDAHPEQPLYKKALGIFLTHTTNHMMTPLWARVAAEPVLGDPRTRLGDMGWLPSPFRYQTDNWTYVTLHNKALGDVRVPTHISLSLHETVTIHDGGTYTLINCHLCHSGIFGDSVIGGAPNKDYNAEWTRRRIYDSGVLAFQESWEKDRRVPNLGGIAGLLGSDMFPFAIREKDGQLLHDTAAYMRDVTWNIMGPPTNQVVGAQAGTWLVFANAAFYKIGAKNLDDFQTPEEATRPGGMLDLVRSRENNTHTLVSIRPWWAARYMGMHFWPGISLAGGDASAGDLMMDLHTPHYGTLIAPNAEDRYAVSQAIQTYISVIESPPYPRPIDSAKAQAGFELYNENCAQCHGEARATDRDPMGPNKKLTLVYNQTGGRVLMDVVGTDPEYIKEYQRNRVVIDNYMLIPDAQKYGLVQRSPRPEEAPYIYAPPLVGLWASAPFLHNGSVPTVYEVLNPDVRPTYWDLDEDPYAYDYESMGVVYQSLSAMPARRESPKDWRVYDTTRKVNGMTNIGHEFGRVLSDAERYQIIEFLKCLNTSNVKPEVEK
jgi:mono/diheme cytochrome c family protein